MRRASKIKRKINSNIRESFERRKNMYNSNEKKNVKEKISCCFFFK